MALLKYIVPRGQRSDIVFRFPLLPANKKRNNGKLERSFVRTERNLTQKLQTREVALSHCYWKIMNMNFVPVFFFSSPGKFSEEREKPKEYNDF